MILGPGPDWDVNRSRPSTWNRVDREKWARERFAWITIANDRWQRWRLEEVLAVILIVGTAAALFLTVGRPLLAALWSLIQ